MSEVKINYTDINEEKEKTYHRILHSFKPEIIVPIAAITNNVDFALGGKERVRMVKTSDNIECIVESFEEKHMCDLAGDITRLYGMEPWSYIQRWYKVAPHMHSMDFFKIKLKPYEK